MALILFVICCALLIIFLALAVFSKSRARFRQQATLEAELKTTQKNESRLRDELNALQAKLNVSTKDPLTGLISWHVFEDRLNLHLKECERYKLTLGVVFIDIDNFKVINDALNYAIGDALLADVAKRLQASIRQVDSVARFSKDTFAILLTQLAKPETAAIVAQRILQSLGEPFHLHQNQLFVTACIGIALYPTDGQDAPMLLRGADHALHLAKQKGSHTYQFYQERLHEKSQRDLMLHNFLNQDAFYHELLVYYAPIIQINQNEIICFEAQWCWHSNELGLVNSAELFEVAEKQRKLNLHTEWLLDKACRQFLHWQKNGILPQYLGIPISIKQLENTHFIYRISQILQDLQFNPEHLLVEVKETTAHIPLESIEKAFNMLRYLGVKIALGDFGSGSFSLHYLPLLPVDYLKLDSALTNQITQHQRAHKLVAAVLQLAKNLDVQVIAQGIQTKEQALLMKELGCELLQGEIGGVPLKGEAVTSTSCRVLSDL